MKNKRNILITGASRGIGRGAALALASDETHIIALARSKQALQTLGDEIAAKSCSATLVPMDLTDYDSLIKLGHSLQSEFSCLDGWLANAAILGPLGPLATLDKRGLEHTLQVNLMANGYLITALTPLLQASKTPRIVFVTSSVARHPRAFWGPYQASKAGLEALALGWADETEALGFKVNLFDPGATRTAMRAKAMPGEDPMTLPSAEDVAEKLVPLLSVQETRTAQMVRYRDLV